MVGVISYLENRIMLARINTGYMLDMVAYYSDFYRKLGEVFGHMMCEGGQMERIERIG